MLGLFNLLPFLNSWAYRTWTVEGIVSRGGRPQETRVSSNGWLSNIILACTDAYATVKLLPMHRAQSPSVAIFPEWRKSLGIALPAAAGWISRYSRPDNVWTGGSYVVQVGPESAILPFVNPSKLQIELGGQSTENQPINAVLHVRRNRGSCRMSHTWSRQRTSTGRRLNKPRAIQLISNHEQLCQA